MTKSHTTDFNLLPWRKMKRDLAKKKRRLSWLAGAVTVGVLMFSGHFYVTKLTRHPVLQQTVDQTLYRNQRKTFNEHFRKTKAKLEQQSLDSLHYIGLLKDGSKVWALISQSDGLVSVVLSGDYLGREHGRVVYIKENVIEIEKTMWGKHGVETNRVLLHSR